MVLTLYLDLYSQPSRAVKLLCDIAGIPYKLHALNIFKGDLQKEDFVELNPTRKVPVIVDDDITLFESGAILRYLCNQYLPKNNAHYPRDSL